MVYLIYFLEGKKDKDRKKKCVFCKQMLTHVHVHIERMRSNEGEVKEIFNLDSKKEREMKLIKLGNLGDHLHNINVREF